MAAAERLLELPAAAHPATWETTRKVAANALVAVDGNRYSVPPGLVGVDVTMTASPAQRAIWRNQAYGDWT